VHKGAECWLEEVSCVSWLAFLAALVAFFLNCPLLIFWAFRQSQIMIMNNTNLPGDM